MSETATTLTSIGSTSNLKFKLENAGNRTQGLFGGIDSDAYVEKSRHIPSLNTNSSGLVVFEYLKDVKFKKRHVRDSSQNDLLQATYLDLKCRALFPNTVVPMEVSIQMSKKGEQDFILLTDQDYFVSVRGFSLSQCIVDETKHMNIFFSESNTIQFYTKASSPSKNARTLSEFAYDFFVKDMTLYAAIAQKINYIKIGIRIETQIKKTNNQFIKFHVGDLFVKSENGVNEIFDKSESKTETIQKRKRDEYTFVDDANKKLRYENVLDLSNYVYKI
jgi:hypothetical protein